MNERRRRFRADVHPHVLRDDLVVLDTWSGIELLDGELSSAVAHLLKDGRALSESVAQFADALDTLDAAYEIDGLHRRGLLEPEEEEAYDGDPALVMTSDYLDPQLEDVNRDALAEGRPWMLARPRGTIVWIGPVFVPGAGPCWACMAGRLREVRNAWRLPEQRAAEAPVARIGLELAKLEAARWKRDPGGPARLLTFDTQSLVQQSHVIVRRRDCAACGDPSLRRSFQPLVLQRRRKTFTFDGGHRSAPPEETYARYVHLVSSLVGVVHDVERADGDTGPLNVFVARHNYSHGGRGAPNRSFGKGMTSVQARTGALCEALERYCGVFRGDEPRVQARFPDLGDDAIHPHSCLGISERQYREREAWNREAPQMLWLPEAFDEEQETEWAPAWSLTHERRRYVAAAYGYYAYRRGTNRFAGVDSNGNAAGTSIEDAVLQGLLELVERDAVGIWWYGRFRRPAVRIDTPYVTAMTREHAAHGRRLRLLDLTTDLGIPVCAAISIDDDPQDLLLGLGAHLDPALAITRAITEANQLLAIPRWRRPYRSEGVDWSFLEPDGCCEMSSSVMPSDDLRDDVLGCVEILRRHALEVIVLDQTREEIGLPVVKVIVPGLRHFRPRFAPGRLYDVPVRLGWIARPLREDDLNPAHLTI